jgi:hypothetical protein
MRERLVNYQKPNLGVVHSAKYQSADLQFGFVSTCIVIGIFAFGSSVILPTIGKFVLSGIYMLLIWDLFYRVDKNEIYSNLHSKRIETAITVTALILIMPTIIAMLAYTNPSLWADEWRHYSDYFFRYSTFEGIIKRQNGHLMLLPNSIFKLNYFMGSGRPENLAALTTVMVFITGWALGSGFIAGHKNTLNQSQRRLTRILFIVCTFSIANYPSTFWGMGVHNQAGVMFSALAILPISGAFGSISKLKNIMVFTFLAFMSASSFSASAAVWFLGVAAAVISKSELKVVTIYTLIALIGFMTTLGFSTIMNGGSNVDISISKLIHACVAMLGLPATLGSGEFLGADQLSRYTVSLKFGGLAISAFAVTSIYLLYNMFKSDKTKNSSNNDIVALRVCWLFGLFAIGSCALIAAGRVNLTTQVEGFLYPRFIPWSYCLWVSLGGFALYFAGKVASRLNLRNEGIFVSSAAGFVIFTTLLSNKYLLSHDISYKYTHDITKATDLISNRNEGGAIGNLWRNDKRDVVQKIANDIYKKEAVIFANDWARRDEKFLTPSELETSKFCKAGLRTFPYKGSDDHQLDGWVRPKKGDLSTIRVLYAINQSDQIVGLALPRFGNLRSVDPREVEARSLRQKVLRKVSRFPGISGYMRGIISLPSVTEKEISSIDDLRYFAKDIKDRTCRVKNF